MDTSKLKKFAQFARRSLMEQVSAKLKLVLDSESAARREQPRAVAELEKQIDAHGKEQVAEKVAYTWFNRFCAFRFMDVNRYTRIGIVSPTEGQFQPEILAEAKMGHIDEEMVSGDTAKKIFALLSGTAPSPDAQSEAYRLLVVAACNFWNKAMPFLFQKIADYTELLMPDDLLSGNSILAYTREAMTPDACEDVEVIGWLYQFYISEKKDEVFDGLKKNKKITPENIPAATQLFTPHWIVRYLVENSLGRLWLLNRPGSKLVEKMDYYIKPEQAETDFLRISKPEEIKICDPACGSGHMLTYAFDLLYAIYEEEGYESAEIPEKILTNNLYGIEIDERAGELAAFALTMKARAKQRRFFNKGVKPNICVLESVHFDGSELKDYMDFVGRDLFTAPLQTTLRQFEEADNFGSLIRPDVTDVDGMLRILESKNVSGQLFISMTHQKVQQALRQADYLSPKYHVVIANPPYMGTGAMNPKLKAFVGRNYPNSKPDIGATFIERCFSLCLLSGYSSIIAMQGWMFLSRYEALRLSILENATIASLAHLGERAFDSIGGAVVSTAAFILKNARPGDQRGSFIRLTEGGSESEKSSELRAAAAGNSSKLFLRKSHGFERVPGSPICYWIPEATISCFSASPAFGDLLDPRKGLVTANNDKYVRLHWEVSNEKIGRGFSNREDAKLSGLKWFPYNKGGERRKWFGNDLFIVNWFNDGWEMQNTKHPTEDRIWATNFNLDYIFKPGLTWSDITTNGLATRIMPSGSLFDDTGKSAFLRTDSKINLELAAAITNTKVGDYVSRILNPTLHFLSGDFARFPCVTISDKASEARAATAIEIARDDWFSFEIAPDFTTHPLLLPDHHAETLASTYNNLRTHWLNITLEMQQLEKENNRIFIEAYGLQDELTPDVPLNEITLTCNPHYRYGNDKSEDELEALLLADTMRELISYAAGCMFGRYALDKSGLILANQGETIADYLKRVPEPSFPADNDNVIPMLDENWFPDDIAERFRTFLKTAFGEEQFEANLKFIEKALGKDIRKFFLKDFYTDHTKRYKKRPIYWLFSSPKGSFNALIYMHRYRPDTVSTVLQYLRDLRSKLTNQVQHLRRVEASSDASKGEKTKALKDIDAYSKVIAELDAYERDTLYPLATEQISIDLDDGVKVNYTKFGSALKKIPGLEAKEE